MTTVVLCAHEPVYQCFKTEIDIEIEDMDYDSEQMNTCANGLFESIKRFENHINWKITLNPKDTWIWFLNKKGYNIGMGSNISTCTLSILYELVNGRPQIEMEGN